MTGTNYVDSAVTGGTNYFYFVKAVNGVGSSTPSMEVSATPAGGTVIPASPANLTAIAGNAKVSLSWNASAGAISYNVYRGTSAGGESTVPLFMNVIVSTFTDTSVTNGVAYFIGSCGQ